MRHLIMDWYHHWLCHPGYFRMHKTTNVKMTCPNQKSDIEHWCKTCKWFQLAKKKKSMVNFQQNRLKLPELIVQSQSNRIIAMDCICCADVDVFVVEKIDDIDTYLVLCLLIRSISVIIDQARHHLNLLFPLNLWVCQ